MEPAEPSRPDLFSALLEAGVREASIDAALGEDEGLEPHLLLARLHERGADPRALLSAYAAYEGLPAVDLTRSVLPAGALALVPQAVADADLVLPLSLEGGRMHLAVASLQLAAGTLAEVRFVTGLEVSPYVALLPDLREALPQAYAALQAGRPRWLGKLAGAKTASRIAVVLPGVAPAVAEPQPQRQAVAPPRPPSPAELASVAPPEPEEEVLQSVEVGTRKPRVLVVDDEPEIVTLLSRTLRAAGFEVHSAGDGKAAEAQLDQRAFDLVLLDAMLPQVHGFELCRRLKANPRRRHIPVIMMSAVYRGWRYAQDARENYGADDYVEKPFHLLDLLRRAKERVAQGSTQRAPERQKAQLHYTEGLKLFEHQDFAAASRELLQSVEADPFSPRAHFALAHALEQTGDDFRAITAYERAIELSPTLFAALRSLSRLYLEKGFRSKAAEMLERAVHAAPDPATREELRTSLLRLL